MIDIAPPPAIYDHAPTRAVTIWLRPQWEVEMQCRWKGIVASGPIYGCAFELGGECFAFVSSIPEWLAIARHEMGRCNGWRQ